MSTKESATLVDLLGDTRARVVEQLRHGAQQVADLADALGLSEVAIRRHLQVLEGDGLVEAETVRRDGPGRPGAQYELTQRAQRLFPDRSGELATELLDYLEGVHGREALHDFLRWWQQRQGARYAEELAATGSAGEGATVERLAEVLSEDGYLADARQRTAPDGSTVTELTQGHCAIKDAAEAHPELCAYETAMFQQLLGGNVTRRQTIAAGGNACVCEITAADGGDDGDQAARR